MRQLYTVKDLTEQHLPASFVQVVDPLTIQDCVTKGWKAECRARQTFAHPDNTAFMQDVCARIETVVQRLSDAPAESSLRIKDVLALQEATHQLRTLFGINNIHLPTSDSQDSSCSSSDTMGKPLTTVAAPAAAPAPSAHAWPPDLPDDNSMHEFLRTLDLVRQASNKQFNKTSRMQQIQGNPSYVKLNSWKLNLGRSHHQHHQEDDRTIGIWRKL